MYSKPENENVKLYRETDYYASLNILNDAIDLFYKDVKNVENGINLQIAHKNFIESLRILRMIEILCAENNNEQY